MTDGAKKAVAAAAALLLLAWLLTQRLPADEAPAQPPPQAVIEQPTRALRTVDAPIEVPPPRVEQPEPVEAEAMRNQDEELPLFELDAYAEVHRAYLMKPMRACFEHALKGGFLQDGTTSSRIELQLELAQGPESAFLDILDLPEELPAGSEDLVTCLRNQLGQIRFSPDSEPFQMDWPLRFSVEPGNDDTATP